MDGTLFWNATVDELKRGYIFDTGEKTYACLLCDKIFEHGIIYPLGDQLFAAEKAIQAHIQSAHPNLFDYYLGMGKIYTGLSAGQEELAKLSYQGLSDKEIATATDTNSTSTVRNQRFAMREKYKQAKILVALFELLEERKSEVKQKNKTSFDSGDLADFHPTATMVDERYAITQTEKDEVLKRYFGKDNQLLIKSFPSKEKKKIIILQKIIENFEIGKHYTEKGVNEILKRYYDDFVTVRRYMIEYGFLDRDKDGAGYWVK